MSKNQRIESAQVAFANELEESPITSTTVVKTSITGKTTSRFAGRSLLLNPSRNVSLRPARLRVQITGKKRRSGPGKGVKAITQLPGGSRTIKSLDTIYEQEGLPPRSPISPGESKHLDIMQTAEFVRQIGRTRIVPRKPIQPTNKADKQQA